MRRMIRNRKGQVGPVGAIILFMFFLVNYFVWLSSWLNTVGLEYVKATSATGFEAFFYSNLNLWVVLIMILGCLGWAYFGGQQ